MRDRRSETLDGGGGLVEILGDGRLRHRQPRADQLARHPVPVHRDVEAIGRAQNRNARGFQVAQHADALLNAPSVGGVAELLDHGAVELLERLPAMEEAAVGEAEAARGQIDDADAGARGAQRVCQPLGGPRARLADDREVHAASAVARVEETHALQEDGPRELEVRHHATGGDERARLGECQPRLEMVVAHAAGELERELADELVQLRKICGHPPVLDQAAHVRDQQHADVLQVVALAAPVHVDEVHAVGIEVVDDVVRVEVAVAGAPTPAAPASPRCRRRDGAGRRASRG